MERGVIKTLRLSQSSGGALLGARTFPHDREVEMCTLVGMRSGGRHLERSVLGIGQAKEHPSMPLEIPS